MARTMEFIVIAPDFMMELASSFFQKAADLFDAKVAFFEVESFMKKPFQEHPSRFFISIGDVNVNAFTKQALPKMVNTHSEDGICIATNENIAIVLAEDNYNILDTVKGLPKRSFKSVMNLKDGIASKLSRVTGKKTSASQPGEEARSDFPQNNSPNVKHKGGMIWNNIKGVPVGVVAGGILLGPVGVLAGAGVGLGTEHAACKKDALKAQTEIAIETFLNDFLPTWIAGGK